MSGRSLQRPAATAVRRGRHAAPARGRKRGAVILASALAVVVAAVLLVTLHLGGGPPGASPHTGVSASAAPTTTVPPTTTTTVPPTTTTSTTDPGTLPQTDQVPSSTSPGFEAEMTALWQGVVAGSATPAMAAFFPETAYVQLKTLGDPASDWTDRLVHDFGLDLAAAHALLGRDAGSATLQEVEVPAQFGHWVPVGVCDNRVGYFEVANSRIVYEEDGQTRSFGIASLISWRGTWYVVHLGAILRASDVGVVEDPESGPGSSADSTTC